jgi:hypothetical protein
LTPLESSFSSSDVGNKEKQKEEESKRKVGETISLNIGTPESPKNFKIGAQCSNEERMKFAKLLGEFQYVFAWSYEDLHGFDPGIIQHVIHIKEGIKPVRKKQIPINPTLEATIRKELEKLLKVGIIFSVKYPEWVSKLVLVHKVTDHTVFFIDLCTFNWVIMKDHFLLPNLEMVPQQVARSQVMPLLDSFSGYSQIKTKGEDAYKTTLITHWGTLNYEHMPSSLSGTSTSFKRPMQLIFDDLIGKINHVYLDYLIVYFKGLSIVSKFQNLWLDPFKIAFVLGTNSYILKDLQERFFSYNTNGSHLKHCVEPT